MLLLLSGAMCMSSLCDRTIKLLKVYLVKLCLCSNSAINKTAKNFFLICSKWKPGIVNAFSATALGFLVQLLVD